MTNHIVFFEKPGASSPLFKVGKWITNLSDLESEMQSGRIRKFKLLVSLTGLTMQPLTQIGIRKWSSFYQQALSLINQFPKVQVSVIRPESLSSTDDFQKNLHAVCNAEFQSLMVVGVDDELFMSTLNRVAELLEISNEEGKKKNLSIFDVLHHRPKERARQAPQMAVELTQNYLDLQGKLELAERKIQIQQAALKSRQPPATPLGKDDLQSFFEFQEQLEARVFALQQCESKKTLLQNKLKSCMEENRLLSASIRQMEAELSGLEPRDIPLPDDQEKQMLRKQIVELSLTLLETQEDVERLHVQYESLKQEASTTVETIQRFIKATS